jgi:hypothetical protein
LKYDLFSTSLLKIHFFHEVMKSGAKWGLRGQGPRGEQNFVPFSIPKGKRKLRGKKGGGLKPHFAHQFSNVDF